jgi:hypothetical protein
MKGLRSTRIAYAIHDPLATAVRIRTSSAFCAVAVARCNTADASISARCRVTGTTGRYSSAFVMALRLRVSARNRHENANMRASHDACSRRPAFDRGAVRGLHNERQCDGSRSVRRREIDERSSVGIRIGRHDDDGRRRE